MSELTLKEALEQYPDECRAVWGDRPYRNVCAVMKHLRPEDRDETDGDYLIGACVRWLAGKPIMSKCEAVLRPDDGGIPIAWWQWSIDPLWFMLEEVRAQMSKESAKPT